MEYNSHPHYEPLTVRVQQEIDKRKQDSAFSPERTKIDDLIHEEELADYDPIIVVHVAAEYGLKIQFCGYNQTHEEPVVKANGKWVPAPRNIMHKKLTDIIICGSCEEKYRAQIEKARELGKNNKAIRLSCFSKLFC